MYKICSTSAVVMSDDGVVGVVAKDDIREVILSTLRKNRSIVYVMYQGFWYSCFPQIERGVVVGYTRDNIEDGQTVSKLDRFMNRNI